MNSRTDDWIRVIVALVMVTAVAAVIGGWITHVVWTVTTLAGPAGITFGQLVLMVLGIFAPPIGAIHGWIIWFT